MAWIPGSRDLLHPRCFATNGENASAQSCQITHHGALALDSSLGRRPARGLAVAPIAAALAHDQPLQQVTALLGTSALASPVLFELRLDCGEEGLVDNRGDVDQDLAIRWCIDPRDRPPGMLRASALGPELLGLERP